MTLLKRGLALATVIVIVGVVGCTTKLPFITSFTGLPASMLQGGIATLTAVGGPGSSAGLWTWTFTASPSGCGTFIGQSPVGPTNSTTVTVTFTAVTPGPCTVTVTLTMASSKTASATQSTTIVVPVTHRAFAYVQIYDTTFPFTDDSVLHLRSAALASPSNCPATGDLECDDDDGALYSSLGGTFIAYAFNSVIAGHPLATTSDVVAVNGFGSSAVGETGLPYRLYRHIVDVSSTKPIVIPPSDPGSTPATAFPVPGGALPLCTYPETTAITPAGTVSNFTMAPISNPATWIIGESISAGDADWYSFSATAGEAIFVAVDMTPDTPGGSHDDLSAWDAVIELRDSAGTLLKSVDGSAATGSPAPPSEALAIRINTSGTYIIAVRHFSATGTGPGYHLTACRTSTVLPAGAEEPLVEKPFTPKYPDDK